MNDVIAQGCIITTTDPENTEITAGMREFLRLPVRWGDRSETWFKMFCILIMARTLVSDLNLKTSVSAKDKVTQCVAVTVNRQEQEQTTQCHVLNY